MIASKSIIALVFVITHCIDLTSAQNESLPWVEATVPASGFTKDAIVSAGLLDQRVYVTNTGDDTTYYSVTIRQEGVQNAQNLRFGIQWLRNLTDLVPTDYRGVRFDVNTQFEGQNPNIVIYDAVDYLVYNSTGGSLNMSDYLDAMIISQSSFIKNAQVGSAFVRDVQSQVRKFTDSIEVQVNFTIPSLDPIGESRLWYRWAYFSGAPSREQIRGNPEPYFYSTYVNIGDFFDTNEFLNIYYIMLALSLFWWFGYPFMSFWGLYVQVLYVLKSLEAISLFDRWPGSQQYVGQLYLGLFWGWFEQFTVVSIMFLATPIPLLAPIVNFMVVLYMYISAVYGASTNDKRLYYGKESDGWIIPEVIDHDAFFDIHFRGI